MRRLIQCFFVISLLILIDYGEGQARQTIADQQVATEAVLRSIPLEFINKARTTLHIGYQHTSHGAQVAQGLFGLQDYKSGDNTLFAITNRRPKPGKLDFNDYAIEKYSGPGTRARDLSGNETGFIQATRNYLDAPENSKINVIMWSWCNIAHHKVRKNYLPGMQTLINEYGPGGSKIGSGSGQRANPVTFIFMTGHGNTGKNHGDRNPMGQAKKITDFCQKNGYFCLDYFGIDTHDMEGKFWDDAGDNGQSAQYGGNFYLDWQNSHTKGKDWYENKRQPNGPIVFGAHNTQHITANRKAYATWWILAQVAGWNPDVAAKQKFVCEGVKAK